MIKSFLELGQIVGTHGIRGELRVNPRCDSPSFAGQFKTVYFDEKGAAAHRVLSCRAHGNLILIRLDGVEGIEAAEALRGTVLYIRRADAALPPGTWFIDELIGCEVLDADTGVRYGRISDVSLTGANDVWHIAGSGGREYLIPAIKSVVINADVAENRVEIRPLKGIFDDED